jgi:hypothetical protein
MTNNHGALLLSWRWTFDDQQSHDVRLGDILKMSWGINYLVLLQLDGKPSGRRNETSW